MAEEVIAFFIPQVSNRVLVLLSVTLIVFLTTCQGLGGFEGGELFIVEQELNNFAWLRNVSEVLVAHNDVLDLS